MKNIGPWPDMGDGEKMKTVFVCDHCKQPDKPYETIRVPVDA
jgi:hypothetical protein